MDSLRRLTSNLNLSVKKSAQHHFSGANPPSNASNTATATSSSGIDTNGLDLTCITERLYVMGYPVHSATKKKNNQNNIDELVTYLEAHHANHYLIINLNAIEENFSGSMENILKNFSRNNNYKNSNHASIAEKVKEQMLDFSWERDGMKAHAPSLDFMFRICYALFAWLSLDPENVVLVNCQTGKTRSGVVLACYLMFARLADDAMEAFLQFYVKRWEMKSLSIQALKDRTPPSIQRFLSSFYTLVDQQKAPNEKPLLLKAIIFRSIPVETQPCVQIWDDYKMIFCSETSRYGTSQDAPVIDWNAEDGFLAFLWENGIELDGGFSFLCSFGDEAVGSDETSVDASSRVLFRYADSTWFLSPGLITLTKNKLDMMKQYEFGFDEENFSIDLVLHESTQPRKSYVPIYYTGNLAVKQGLIEITKHHFVLPDPAMHSNFIKMGFQDTATTFALQRSQNIPNIALDLLHSDGLMGCFSQETKLIMIEDDEKVKKNSSTKETPPSTPVHRQTTAEIVAMQSQRIRYSTPTSTDTTNVCCVCKEDDYMMRPQIVQCIGTCRGHYHTTCAGLKKIPFGLTTLSDRTNHAVYVKKYFSGWECNKCAPPPFPSTPAPAPTVNPIQTSASLTNDTLPTRTTGGNVRLAVNSNLPAFTTPTGTLPAHPLLTHHQSLSDAVPSDDKYEKLKEFLAVSGISVEDLLRAATTPNISINSPAAAAAVATISTPISTESIATAELNSVITESLAASSTAPASSSIDQETDKPVSPRIAKSSVARKLFNSSSNDRSALLHSVVSTVLKKNDYQKESFGSSSSNDEKLASSTSSAKPAEGSETTDISSTKSTLEPSETVMGEKAEEDNEEVAAAKTKYRMMLKRGVPFGAVQNCMKKEGLVDPSSLEPLPEQPANNNQEKTEATGSEGKVLLKDVEEFARFFKMLKLGFPKDAVKHKMTMEGVDPSILEFGPNVVYDEVKDKLPNTSNTTSRAQLLENIRNVRDGDTAKSTKAAETKSLAEYKDDNVQLKDHEKYGKYFKMLQMGLPEGAVRHKMKQEESDERALELGGDAPYSKLRELLEPKSEEDDLLLKDHPVYAQYFKMLKLGLPEGAVRHKMIKDKVNVKALDLGPNGKFSALQPTRKQNDVLLKDHPVYSKYFTMLKVGLPEGAVRQKMLQDNVDIRALEYGPDAFASSLDQSSSSSSEKPKSTKKTNISRRKKLHWQPISDDRLSNLNQQTIWEEDDDVMVDVDMDMDELESLFFANTEQQNKNKKKHSFTKSLKRKQAVTLIDGKRAMNAAISLARIKLTYAEISCAIRTLDPNGLTFEQLKSLSEFLPTAEEVQAVQAYTGDYQMLGEAEKFILDISKVERYTCRMQCLLYQLSFSSRSQELYDSLQHITSACEEVKGSRLLKILLSIVLKLGNTLNNGGDAENDNGIRGFTVDSLLRLGHTKALNQKTTVLHYLVRLLKKNHPQVLNFQQELKSVPFAARESFDLIEQESCQLDRGLKMLQKESEEKKNEEQTQKTLDASIFTITKQLNHLNKKIDQTKNEVRGVFDYFGEDPLKNPTDFFTTLTSFCHSFEKAKKEVDTEDEAKERAERIKLKRTMSIAPSSSTSLSIPKHINDNNRTRSPSSKQLSISSSPAKELKTTKRFSSTAF